EALLKRGMGEDVVESLSFSVKSFGWWPEHHTETEEEYTTGYPDIGLAIESLESMDFEFSHPLDPYDTLASLEFDKLVGNLVASLGQDDYWGRQQRMIDPLTGRDVTGEALAAARSDYEVALEQVISEAAVEIAGGASRTEIWPETERRIKDLQQKLWDSHKGGWLQDWLQPSNGEDRFARDLKLARHRLGLE
ncbi:MAG: hypothetical protein ABIH46_02905, partial [Chloroflexota bacterium]